MFAVVKNNLVVRAAMLEKGIRYRRFHRRCLCVVKCDYVQKNYFKVEPLSVGVPVRLYSSEPLKPSSKVEETVTALKEKAATDEAAPKAVVKAPKKPLKQRIKDELLHYYHGFRLLFIDIKISWRLLMRLLSGYQLTRREHNLLVRTVGDVFRMVPFSLFIVVPFLEFTLPIFIKFFPGMLPSTFRTSQEKEAKIKQSLKVKLEMAKFLQKTLDDMAVTSKGHSSQSAKEFAQFFEKVRTSGELTTSEEIMKFSKLFEDNITLDNLPRPQLMALCRVLEMNPIGTTNFLRFQLRLKLRSLVADDMMIQKEGINSLTQAELQAACRARGMKALGVSEERLKAQLSQWLDLSLNKKVPPSLLLLSQAFMLPDSTPTEEKLAATIQALPDVVGTATKAVIGEREGKVDYKTKIEVLKEEVNMIREERKEQQEEDLKEKAQTLEQKKEEVMVDCAPTLMDKAKLVDPVLRAVVDDIKKTAIKDKLLNEDVTNKDMEALENALETLGKDRNKLLVEKEELQELREEMAEYQEDIADLQKITMASGKESELQETAAAKHLFRKVNKMISKMEAVLETLEKEEQLLKGEEKVLASEATAQPACAKKAEEMLRIDDLIATLRKVQGVQESSLERLTEFLSKMDADKDGVVRVDVLLKMLELVGNEKVKLNKKQVDELISLIDKEEAIEMDEAIYKALKKGRESEDKTPPQSPVPQKPPTSSPPPKTNGSDTSGSRDPPSVVSSIAAAIPKNSVSSMSDPNTKDKLR